jgi:hypothetical protein
MIAFGVGIVRVWRTPKNGGTTTTMKRLNYLIGIGLLAALNVPAVDVSKLPPPSARKDVTYEKDIKPLLQASCVNCHGADRPKAGLRLDSLEAVLKGSKEGKVLEVGKSEKSSLVIAVSQLDPELVMPPKPRARGGANAAPGGAPAGGPPQPKPLTAEQVGLVRAWIDNGAK